MNRPTITTLIGLLLLLGMVGAASDPIRLPVLRTDKTSYEAGEIITVTAVNVGTDAYVTVTDPIGKNVTLGSCPQSCSLFYRPRLFRAGEYLITLHDDTSTIEHRIIIEQPPQQLSEEVELDFRTDQTSYVFGETVRFIGFPDGTRIMLTVQTPTGDEFGLSDSTFTPEEPGNYTVTGTIRYRAQELRVEVKIQVREPQTPDYELGVRDIGGRAEVFITSANVPDVTFHVAGPDGVVMSLASRRVGEETVAEFAYILAGNYSINETPGGKSMIVWLGSGEIPIDIPIVPVPWMVNGTNLTVEIQNSKISILIPGVEAENPVFEIIRPDGLIKLVPGETVDEGLSAEHEVHLDGTYHIRELHGNITTNVSINLTRAQFNPKIRDRLGRDRQSIIFVKNRAGEIISQLGSTASDSLPDEQYTVEVSQDLEKITGLRFDKTQISDTFNLRVDTPSEKGQFTSLYAVDPSGINFESGVMTAVADDTNLFKCKDWDFDNGVCNGGWTKIADTIPGQEYLVRLTPDDPGFGEGLATINTNKSTYHTNESAEIYVVVLDSEGHLVRNAQVNVNVTDPVGTVYFFSTGDETIAMRERGIYTLTFNRTMLEGNYDLTVKALANGVDSSMTSSFLVRTYYEFDIHRRVPLSTDPWRGPYESTIEITDYTGSSSFTYTESIPKSFNVTAFTGTRIDEVPGRKLLVWEGLTNGSTLEYSVQPPLVTPVMYEIGPGTVQYGTMTYDEARPWLLAVDPAGDTATPFLNSDFEKNTFANWTWSANSWQNNGENCAGEFAVDGKIIYNVTTDDWELIEGSFTGGGGEQETFLDGRDDLGNGYQGMLTSTKFTIASYVQNVTFWFHSDYRSADNNQCYNGDGNRFDTTAAEVANDWGEGCWAVVWQENGTVGRADDVLVYEIHAARYTASASCTAGGNPFCNAQKIDVDVTAYEGDELYITGECIGRGNVDDALFQLDGLKLVYNEVAPDVNSVSSTPSYSIINGSVNITANITSDERTVIAMVTFANSTEQNFTMTDGDSDDIYDVLLTGLLEVGGYQVVIWADNEADNINESEGVNFTVLPPVINTTVTSYITDESVIIDGRYYRSDAQVTLELRNESGAFVSGYPQNTTTDSQGNVSDSWIVPPDVTEGVHSLTAYDPNISTMTNASTFTVIESKVTPNYQTYAKGDTAYYVGEGFAGSNDVNVTILDPSLDPVTGFPRTIQSNASGRINFTWDIPGGADLGDYIVNATEDNHTNRSGQDYFKIASAVIHANDTAFLYGDEIAMYGYNWDPLANVTLSIVNPTESTSYGPVNITANSTGEITDEWNISCGSVVGSYTIASFAPNNASKENNFSFILSARTLIVSTDYPWYKTNDEVTVSVIGFPDSRNITVNITYPNGTSVNTMPWTYITNSSGGANFTWKVPDVHEDGTRTATSEFTSCSVWLGSDTFEIVTQTAQTASAAYSSGDNVVITGSYWNRDKNVTLDIRNSTEDSASGYPMNTTANAVGVISDSWTAQPGTNTIEDYILYAWEWDNKSVNVTYNFSVTLVATLETDSDYYVNNTPVQINGSFYTGSGNVQLIVRDLASGGILPTYPKLVAALGSGDINDSWNTGDYCPGTYRVESEDQTYPAQLNAQKNITLAYFDGTSKTCDEEWGFDCSAGPPESGANTYLGCPTGTGNDESVINMTLNATIVNPYDQVDINCWFDPYSTASEDYVYYYNGTGWRQVYGGNAPSGVNYERTFSVTVDNVTGNHYFRCIIDYDGENDDCANGGTWYDNDDVSLYVMDPPSTCTAVEGDAPAVTNITITPGNVTLAGQVNISATVTDASTINFANATILLEEGRLLNISLTTSGGGLYSGSTTGLGDIGPATATIIARDTYFNTNNSETKQFNVTFEELSLDTPKQSYVRNETITAIARGFNPGADIQIRVYNSTGENQAGFPRTFQANTSGRINFTWFIPLTQSLGTYTLNATDTTNSTRTVEQTVNVVLAVMQANETTYEVGDRLVFNGSYWDSDVNVTITVTDPSEAVVFGPINYTTNSSGELNGTWDIPWDEEFGDHNLSAYQSDTPTKTDYSVFTVSARTVHLASNQSFYHREQAAYLNATHFRPGANVTIEISDGVIVGGYPKNVSVLSSGKMNDTWYIQPSEDLATYTVLAYDATYPTVNDSITFRVTQPNVTTDSDSYNSGDQVQVLGGDWDADINVTIEIRNSTGDVQTGYPTNTTATTTGTFAHYWSAQPGANTIEDYTVYAWEWYNKSINDTYNFSVTLTATLVTDKAIYGSYENVTINGSFYTQDSGVQLQLRSMDTNTLGEYYPKVLTADGSGNIGHIWNTSDFCPGIYRVESEDQTYPAQLNALRNFTISYDIAAFDNAGFEWDNETNWQWLGNRYSVANACGESSAHANYNLGGIDVLNSSDSAYFAGSWEQGDGLPVGGGGSEETTLSLGGTDDYSGMMMSQVFVLPPNGESVSFWAYGYYLSADAGGCIAGSRYNGTLNVSANADRAEMISFAVWIDDNGDTVGNDNIADDFIILEEWGSNLNDGSTFIIGPGTYTVNVSGYGGKQAYVTGEIIGTGGQDDAMLQIDNVRIQMDSDSCTDFDSTRPSVTNISPSQGDNFTLDSLVNITATITDDRTVRIAKVQVNMSNGSVLLENMTDFGGGLYNYTFAGTQEIGRYNVSFFVNDTSSNSNNTESTWFWVNDTTWPQWSANVTSPDSPVTYTSGAAYQFNLTWTDNYEIGGALIEHNFTGNLVNYTTQNATTEYYYDYSDLAAGEYVWRMYANDSSGNWNQSDQWDYVVLRRKALLNLTLDGQEDNISLTIGSTVNITAVLLDGQGNLTLYRNGSIINQGPSPLENLSSHSVLGTWNITLVYNETENYTANTTSWFVTWYDNAKPIVESIVPANVTEFNLTDTINISVNATDDSGIANVTANVTWYGGQQLMLLVWDAGASRFEANFTTSKTGRHNVSYFANDTSGNRNDTEDSWFMVLEEPAVTTDTQSYIVNETVYIDAVGFYPGENVTVNITNSSGSGVGFPINYSANITGGINLTWEIPSDQVLGPYTVNATGTQDTGRSDVAAFSIVSAVIQTDNTTYEQGMVVYFSGYSWGSNINVTVNITDPSSTGVFGPFNYTTNSSAEMNGTWVIPYDEPIGTHSIWAIAADNPSKKDNRTFEVTARPVNVSVELPWYWEGQVAETNGTGFAPGSNVTVNVYNASSLAGYPLNVSANASGYANNSVYLVGAGQGNYTVTYGDATYPNLNSSASFLLVNHTLTMGKQSYSNGETVDISGLYWARYENVTISIRNASGSELAGYPVNATADGNGTIYDSLTADAAFRSSHNHTVIAYLDSDPTRNASAWYVALREAVTNANDTVVDQNETLQTNGSFFTADSYVEVLVRSTNGTKDYYYPILIQTNSSGGFSYDYFTEQICEGDYLIEYVDFSNPGELFSNITFLVSHTDDASSERTATDYEANASFDEVDVTYDDTATSNEQWQYFSAIDAGTVQGYVNYTMTANGVSPSLVRHMNLTVEYCHSGNQAAPLCNTGGHVHEGTRNGEQTIEIYNFTAGAWKVIGNLTVNETDTTESTTYVSLPRGFTDYISGDEIYVRYKFNFTRVGSEDDILLIDYSAIDLDYDVEVDRSCVPFTNDSLEISILNSSLENISNAKVTILNTSNSELDNETGGYYRYLPASTYNLKIEAPTSRGGVEIVMEDVAFTGNAELLTQVITNYTGPALPHMNATSPMFYLDDSDISFTYAQVAVPLDGENLTYIMHCNVWVTATSTCNAWEVNDSEDFTPVDNGTHLLFNVTSFSTFGGGAGKTLPNVTQIRVYNVTGQGDKENGGALVLSGVEINATLYFNESYRVEIDVTNEGQPWNIANNDIVEHRFLNTSWYVNTSAIWYTDDGNATNFTGGSFPSGTVDWDTSGGGRLTNGETATFFYVFRPNSSRSKDYEVVFLVNDTSKNSGSIDNSTYHYLRKPDVMVNRTSITFNVSDPEEGDLVNISIEIYNIGGGYAYNVTVTVQDNTTGSFIGSAQDVNLTPYGNATINVTWTAEVGTHQIRVQADTPLETNGDNDEDDESNNEAFRNITVSAWHTFYGDVSGNITLRNSANQSIYNWQPASLFGTVYIADGDSNIQWDSLQALGKDKNNVSTYGDFDEADIALNMTGFNDSMNITFLRNGVPKSNISTMIFGKNVSNIAIDNSTSTNSFITGALWDTSDSLDNGYDDSEEEDLVFIARLNEDTLGEFGTYDYEIKVPSRLAGYKAGADTVYFYGELR